jgi:hypothetical protein
VWTPERVENAYNRTKRTVKRFKYAPTLLIPFIRIESSTRRCGRGCRLTATDCSLLPTTLGRFSTFGDAGYASTDSSLESLNEVIPESILSIDGAFFYRP